MAENRATRIPITALGLSLSLFFVIAYVLCILFYLVIPDVGSGHKFLELMLPFFELLSWQSFLLGLVESFAFGWIIALVWGPLYNFFATRSP